MSLRRSSRIVSRSKITTPPPAPKRKNSTTPATTCGNSSNQTKKQKITAAQTKPPLAATSSHSQVVYVVMRDEDNEWGSGSTIQAIYRDLEKAKLAVKENLVSEWSPDCFETYATSTDNNNFPRVDAQFEEGERASVYILEKTVL